MEIQIEASRETPSFILIKVNGVGECNLMSQHTKAAVIRCARRETSGGCNEAVRRLNVSTFEVPSKIHWREYRVAEYEAGTHSKHGSDGGSHQGHAPRVGAPTSVTVQYD